MTASHELNRMAAKRGNRAPKPPGIPSVETQPCTAGGLHVLTNDAEARTTCEGCGETWAALDASMRAGKRGAS